MIVVAEVAEGVSAIGVTVIVAVAVPLRPLPVPSVAACTLKPKVVVGLNRFAAGVNFNPALPSAKVMKSPLLIWVVPLFLKSEPLAIAVILKCVTSAPSAALRLMTRPVVLCVSSLVVVPVTDGGLAMTAAVSVTVAKLPLVS